LQTVRLTDRTATSAGVNASWFQDFVRVYSGVDISVAVQTPGGLQVECEAGYRRVRTTKQL
jgi:hypothetical protein